jgi:uncharacterized protein
MIRALLILALALPAWAHLALPAWAQVAVPPLKGRVTDLTGTLKPEQTAALEQMLQGFEARKGSQIAVLMVPTTAPETIEQYALRAGEEWKIGRKKVDDGAILVVAKDDRTVRVEVGYGLEGALNDATANRIIREVIVPRFREGDFFGGLSAGVDRMIRVIDGEPLPAPPRASPGAQGSPIGAIGQMLPVLLILAVVVGAVLRRMLGRFVGSIAAGGAVGAIAWLLAGALAVGLIAGVLAFIFTLLGGGSGRRYYGGFPGGFGRGGFGGGGFGGGGFRGGGGSFGGGGASGRW